MKITKIALLFAILITVVLAVMAEEQMVGKEAPPIKASAWINTEPLTADKLKGKYVLLEFWATW
ncbi:MAG: hypothetical protein ABIH42_03280 [Planctomycetota bacterium]